MSSLARAVRAAVGVAFSHSELAGFAPLDAASGDGLCRYYRGDERVEHEVCVYRDKRWTKAGGVVGVELYCLVADVQRALTGVEQRWSCPDYAKPLAHFQHGLGIERTALRADIRCETDAARFGERLQAFLVHEALPWFAQFETPAGVAAHFLAGDRHFLLLQYYHYLGDGDAVAVTLERYLEGLPRQNADELGRLVVLGILAEDDRVVLERAALQEESEYARRVREWLTARG